MMISLMRLRQSYKISKGLIYMIINFHFYVILLFVLNMNFCFMFEIIFTQSKHFLKL